MKKQHLRDRDKAVALCGIKVDPTAGGDLLQPMCKNCLRSVKPGDRLAAVELGTDGRWRVIPPPPALGTYTVTSSSSATVASSGFKVFWRWAS